jgi:hypothetical protein
MLWEFPTYQPGKELDWAQLESQFSWIRDMKGVPQDRIWHAEGDVFVHTQMVVRELTDLPEFKSLGEQDKHILLAAALLHDVEKRSTTTEETIDGRQRIVSPRHAQKGEFTTRSILYPRHSNSLWDQGADCQTGQAPRPAHLGHRKGASRQRSDLRQPGGKYGTSGPCSPKQMSWAGSAMMQKKCCLGSTYLKSFV